MERDDKGREYITVGELSVGFSENIMESTDEFVGRDIILHYEFGKKARIRCMDREVLKWETEDQGRRERFVCSYRAIKPRTAICLMDFIVSYGDSKSISVILDV